MTQSSDPNNPQGIPPAGSTTPPGGTPPGYAPGAAPVPYAGPGTPGGYAGPAADADAKQMGMLAHLLGLIGFSGPLIIWLVKRETSPFVNDQGKEALNWQLTLLIGYIGTIVLRVVLGHINVFLGCIGAVLTLGIFVVNVIFLIQGAMAANTGIAYRYPFAIRLVK